MSKAKAKEENLYPEGEEEEEEEEEEEDEEEEEEEWDELKPLEELEELEDGPSTFFVGGFSISKKLSSALEGVKYKEDRVLLFPGVHGGPSARTPADREDVLELDEYVYAGLHIESVPFYLGKKTRYSSKELYPKVGRRVGPWCVYLANAMASTSGENADRMAALPPPSTTASPANPLLAGAAMGARKTDASSSSGTTTSMASSLYGKAITPTEVDASAFPVMATRLVLRYDMRSQEEKEADARPPLKHYEQIPDEEEEESGEEEDGEGGADGGENADRRPSNSRAEDDEEEEEEEDASTAPSARTTTITIQGICFLGGLVWEPLTRSTVQHCVLGIPSTVMKDFPITEQATVVAKGLSEGTLRSCIIYGASQCGLYAFPHSQIHVQHCIIDGPGMTEVLLQGSDKLRSIRHLSSLAMLEYRTRLRLGGSGANASRTHAEKGLDDDGGLGDGVLGGGGRLETTTQFIVPQKVCCDVGVCCDDADIELQDCMISNTRLGISLHEGCDHARLEAVDVRCCLEVGIYYFGLSGCARLSQSSVRCCGRECILIDGPHDDVVRQAMGAYKAEHHIVDPLPGEDGDAPEEEEEEAEEETEAKGPSPRVKTKHPVFAQHPSIKKCSIRGAVRVQGEVFTGAVRDNVIFRPLREGLGSVAALGGMAAAEAKGGEDLIIGPNLGSSYPRALHGFVYSGVEGSRATPAVSSG